MPVASRPSKTPTSPLWGSMPGLSPPTEPLALGLADSGTERLDCAVACQAVPCPLVFGRPPRLPVFAAGFGAWEWRKGRAVAALRHFPCFTPTYSPASGASPDLPLPGRGCGLDALAPQCSCLSSRHSHDEAVAVYVRRHSLRLPTHAAARLSPGSPAASASGDLVFTALQRGVQSKPTSKPRRQNTRPGFEC